MRIISKFKDYYDSVQGVMYDSDICYIRKSEEFELDCKAPYIGSNHYWILYIIGFCNKIYPALVFKNINYQQNKDLKKALFNKKLVKFPGDVTNNTFISYDLKDLKLGIENNKIRYPRKNYAIHKGSYEKNRIEEFCKEIQQLDLFEKYQTPIFSILNTNCYAFIDTSPTLKDFNFQQIHAPYQAYQELVMFINNKAVTEYPTQITDNIVLRDSKGFDKTSFKKGPTKSLKHKKRNK